MDNIIKEHCNLDIIYQDNIFYIESNKIAKYLEITNIHVMITNYTDKEKTKLYKVDSRGGNQLTSFLSEYGIKRLLCSSRKPNAVLLASLCGIENNYKYIPIETSFVINIKKAFDGEEIFLQYKVDKYNIDIYFPKYKLAIEIDEYRHKFQKENDNTRQEYIEKKLDCKFIRIKEKEDIFESINKIIKEIYIK